MEDNESIVDDPNVYNKYYLQRHADFDYILMMENPDNTMYTVKLNDGTEISDLRINGTVYISQDQIDENIFKDNLLHVVVTSVDMTREYNNLELVLFEEKDGETTFAFREISESELMFEKIRSDLEYLAMMTDVDI